MAYTHKEDRGTLFVNDKQGNENWCDWSGTALIGGREYYVSEWNVSTDREGNPLPKDKYRKNLSFKLKDSQRAPNPAKSEDFDDPIPF